MASTIITKNSSTASAIPAVGDLTKGELAVNVTDKKVYTKDNSAAIVKIVGSLGNQEANAVAITGGSIAGITDLAVADGGTGASTASDARTNLGLGTIATQAASSVTITGGSVTGITDITVADGGTGASTAANARTNLGAAASGANSDITSLSGLTTALSVAQGGTGITSLGTGVATFLGTPSSANLASAVTDETGSGSLVFANSPTLVTPALGTPSALVGTNITGTASGLTAGNVTTNANLTGAVTSVGNATSLGSFTSSQLAGALTDETGSGSAVFATSPTLVTPILGTPTSATLTNATGLPISTGVSGLGTGVATALAVNTGSAGAPVLFNGALGTPSGGTLTSVTGLPLTTGVTGTLPTANGGTNLTSFTSGGVVYASSSSALATGSGLTFNGTDFAVVNGDLTIGTNGKKLFVNYIANNSGTDLYIGSSNTIFTMAGTEAMRLTPTSLYTASGINVGFGTSNPQEKLVVSNGCLQVSGSLTSLNRPASSVMDFLSGVTRFFSIGANSSTYGGFSFRNATTTTNTEVLAIDSAGNLGLGVTPSAWTSNRLAYQNSSSAFWTVPSVPDLCFLSANFFDDGADKYIANGYASYYRQGSGAHSWHTAPNNTSGAGASAALTQAMTLNASGDLLVGTTSTTYGAAGRGVIEVNGGSTSIMALKVNNSGAGYLYHDGLILSVTNVLNGPLLFGNNSTERARIDTSGNLLLGITATSSYADGKIVTDTSGTGASFKTSTVGAACLIGWNSATSGDNVFSIFVTETSPTVRGSITYNRTGGLTVYNTTSDYRAKDIIGPVTNSGSLIDSVPVYMGKMKWAEQERPMFIAHEVPAYAHTGEKDAVDADGNPVYQQMDASALIPVMWAEIQSLRQRLSAANL